MSEPLPSSVDLQAVLITLHLNKRQSLVVLLAADGSINRLGTGGLGNTETAMFIGITDSGLFRSLVFQVNPEWFKYTGRQFEFRDRRGAEAELRIIFKTATQEYRLEFLYGSDSEGPPSDIGAFVVAAVNLTDPWYEEQKQKAAAKGKPWWKLW